MIIKLLGEDNLSDINIKNEPFELIGKVIPSLKDGKWGHSIEMFDLKEEMCFPDFSYEYDENSFYIGAYEGNNCIGLAILRRDMFKYLYLDDLKVCKDYRHSGVGTSLISECFKIAKDNGYLGIYTICQDNNLSAFKFYIKNGFRIGGFDNVSYNGTPQENKANIFLYKD